MKFTERFEYMFRAILPSPFSIALLLSLITLLCGLAIKPDSDSWSEYSMHLLSSWEIELWNKDLLAFAVQMMLMLVLGHVLALSPIIARTLNNLTKLCNSNSRAVFFCTLFTIMMSLFNWGLGLIFGAIFARKIGEYSIKNKIKINYPLIAAAGYVGLMVWHGGISGSAPIKVAEEGHLINMAKGILGSQELSAIPDKLGFTETIFSSMNIFTMICLIVLVPISLGFISKYFPVAIPDIDLINKIPSEETNSILPAEKLDQSKIFSIVIGLLILIYNGIKVSTLPTENIGSLSFINPNYINLNLLGLCLIFHAGVRNFLTGLESAISGVSGILIQFPLYFGIMGLMKASGLIEFISTAMINISNEITFPIFTFISSGIVNIFVPSGGGQWMVQGPIIIKAASSLGVPLSKAILALSYGDQITNMLQPFWALPLLGITKLKAGQILPYTLILFLIGCIIFIGTLFIF